MSTPAMDADGRGTVAYDSPSPATIGLVGDRAIEPLATDYATAVNCAGVPGSASTVEQSRWLDVQRHTTGDSQVPGIHVFGPRVQATTAVQRSVGAGAHPAVQWPPGALAGTRSGVEQQVSPIQPARFIQFVTTAPAVTQSPLQPSTELIVQRAEGEPAAATDPVAATEPVAATGPASATGAATGTGPAGTQPAMPTGSSSPTEVDNLVRRLYEPIVRRLKAELQLDRERAGRSLDLWH
jgi:hypothetical protein